MATEEGKRFDLAEVLSDPERRNDHTLWRDLGSVLSIAEKTKFDRGVTKQTVAACDKNSTRISTQLKSQGFSLMDSDTACWEYTLRQGIESLHRNGIPASFVFLFDEAWLLAHHSKYILERSTHDKNIFNFDLLAWYIPPGEGGFSPHRDRQPDDAPSSFHDDGQAKFVTQWFALSDATPENSCLYVIPKPHDPGYTEGDMDETGDPLQRALSTKQSYQHIRALPRKVGQSVLFTHRIIHWGSQADIKASSSDSVAPRVAMSFVCSDPDFEAPYLVNHEGYFWRDDNDPFLKVQLPPHHIRLLLICAQLLIYYQRFDLDKAVIKACYDYCKLHQDELEESYRKKVFVEFVKAMKEDHNDTKDKVSPSDQQQGDVAKGQDDDEDDEDAVMEEMLNAEQGGYGEFEDDFDELEEEIHQEESQKIDREDKQEEEEAIDGDDDDEEELDLFGKRTQQDTKDGTETKKLKTST